MSFSKRCKTCGKDFVSSASVAKFCSRGCSTKFNLSNYWKGKKRVKQTGENNHRWNNGISLTLNYKGYLFLQNTTTKSSSSLHKRIAELFLKRRLVDEEVVHHINGDKLDNRPTNLYICKNNAEHNKIHHQHLHCVSNCSPRNDGNSG